MRKRSLPEGYPEVLGPSGETLYLLGFQLTKLLMKGGEKFMAKSKKKGINPVMAGAAGAAIGAGIAVAATAAMSNKKTRKTITDTFDAVRERASERMPQLQMDGKQLREGMKMGKIAKVLRGGMAAQQEGTSGKKKIAVKRVKTARKSAAKSAK